MGIYSDETAHHYTSTTHLAYTPISSTTTTTSSHPHRKSLYQHQQFHTLATSILQQHVYEKQHAAMEEYRDQQYGYKEQQRSKSKSRMIQPIVTSSPSVPVSSSSTDTTLLMNDHTDMNENVNHENLNTQQQHQQQHDQEQGQFPSSHAITYYTETLKKNHFGKNTEFSIPIEEYKGGIEKL
jgi:hypothetical protein